MEQYSCIYAFLKIIFVLFSKYAITIMKLCSKQFVGYRRIGYIEANCIYIVYWNVLRVSESYTVKNDQHLFVFVFLTKLKT